MPATKWDHMEQRRSGNVLQKPCLIEIFSKTDKSDNPVVLVCPGALGTAVVESVAGTL